MIEIPSPREHGMATCTRLTLRLSADLVGR